MRVSVIIPYKNAAPWLSRCIESVITSGGELEILLINDYSTDDSEQIARGYDDKRIRFYNNEGAAGVSGARNTGIDHATGEWLIFLDADDELKKGAYYQIQRAIEVSGGFPVIQFNHQRQYGPGVSRVVKHWNYEGMRTLNDLPAYWPPVWNKAYNADMIHNNCIYFEGGMQFGEDELFNLNAFEVSRGIYSSQLFTMIHHFDNANSLAKSATFEALKFEVAVLEDYRDSLKGKDTEMYKAIDMRLFELSLMARYKEVFKS